MEVKWDACAWVQKVYTRLPQHNVTAPKTDAICMQRHTSERCAAILYCPLYKWSSGVWFRLFHWYAPHCAVGFSFCDTQAVKNSLLHLIKHLDVPRVTALPPSRKPSLSAALSEKARDPSIPGLDVTLELEDGQAIFNPPINPQVRIAPRIGPRSAVSCVSWGGCAGVCCQPPPPPKPNPTQTSPATKLQIAVGAPLKGDLWKGLSQGGLVGAALWKGL